MKSSYYQLFLICFLFFVCLNLHGQSRHYSCKEKKTPLLRNQSFNLSSQAEKARSDTIDILNYTINLDITDFTNKTISGNCKIHFQSKMNGVNSVSLDLLQLNIDSINQNGILLNYSYNDTLIVAYLSSVLNIGDTSTVTIYYNGSPQGDPSGWGGWYWQGSYAFNLGVGFDANPHNYGRVWFPCFDNFVERSTFEFNITTSGGKISSCNGVLASETTISGDTILRKWLMNDEIPSYLACVAVADYTVVNQTHQGINGVIPIQLHARASDTTSLKSSFTNLKNCIAAFENGYGPFRWDKVGYSLVPFSSGAMEHATNIAYPTAGANGSLAWEDLMAHELSHHWWGDLATCETAEDMWINEGMAVYSEFLFFENVYGWDDYIDRVRDNHKDMLHFLHHNEGGYLAISGVPHELTYGDHVYLKGADVAHTLRGYLGDSLFYYGLTEFLNNNQFTHVNSYDFRDGLSTATGVDLTSFFDNWVFNGGWPHFSVDSFVITPNAGLYDVDVYIKQKIRAAPALFGNVPLEITFMDANWNEITEKITADGATSSFTFQLPIEPALVILNRNNLISQAVTDDELVLKSTGMLNLSHGMLTVTVNDVSDSAFLRVEHHWAAPDPIKDFSTLKMKLSADQYWTVDGILPTDFSASARIVYNAGLGNGYLDSALLNVTEDSLHLLYRRDASEEWREFEYYTKDMLGSTNNKLGKMDIDSLLLGQYVLANEKFDAAISEFGFSECDIVVYPNPFNSTATIEIQNSKLKTQNSELVIYDLFGRKVKQVQISSRLNGNKFQISRAGLANGVYILTVRIGGKWYREKLVVGD